MDKIQNLVQSLISWVAHSPIVSSIIVFIVIILLFNVIANEYL